MKLFHRIADLLTGGALTQQRRRADAHAFAHDHMQELRYEDAERAYRYSHALRQIRAMETPNASAASRRMAAVARIALDNSGDDTRQLEARILDAIGPVGSRRAVDIAADIGASERDVQDELLLMDDRGAVLMVSGWYRQSELLKSATR